MVHALRRLLLAGFFASTLATRRAAANRAEPPGESLEVGLHSEPRGGHAALSEGGTHYLGGDRFQLEAGLADVSNAAYRLRPHASGWELALNWTSPGFGVLPGMDNVGIYMQGDRCALAFSGSNDLADWVDDFTGSFATMDNSDCGLVGIHEGIFQEWQEFILEPEWNRDFVPFLDSDRCAGGISTVGHSLGGGVAVLMAVCQSNLAPGRSSVQVADLMKWGRLRENHTEVFFPTRQFSVYTVGTPAISRTPMLNGRAPDGVFPGTRCYNSDRYSQDWAPTVGQLFGFYHPRMNALRLKDHWFGGVEGVLHSGSTDGTDLLPPELTRHGLPKVPSPLWHMCGQYVGRLGKLVSQQEPEEDGDGADEEDAHSTSLAQSLGSVFAEYRAEHFYARKRRE